MKRKIYLSAFIASICIAASLCGCGNNEKKETAGKTAESSVTETAERSDATMSASETEAVVSKSAEKLTEEAAKATKEEQATVEKLLPQISEMYVLLNSSKVNLTTSLKDNLGIVKEIKVVESDLQSNKTGEYSVTYAVTVYTKGLENAMQAVKEKKNIEKYVPVDDDETKSILITEKVSVIKESEAQEIARKEENVGIVTDKGETYTVENKKDTSNETTGTTAKDDKAGDSKAEVTTEPSSGTNTTPETTKTPAANPTTVPTVAPTQAPTHTHDWVAQTKTVHHDAVTTQQWVQDTAAYDEPVYEEQPVYESVGKVRCKCGAEFDRVEQWEAHVMDREDNYDDWGHGAYEVFWVDVQTGTQTVQTGTVHHDATGHYETVVVKDAYDETVTTGYVCSGCGATK